MILDDTKSIAKSQSPIVNRPSPKKQMADEDGQFVARRVLFHDMKKWSKLVEPARIWSNAEGAKFQIGRKGAQKGALFVAFGSRRSDFGTLNHAPNLTEPTWTNTVHAAKNGEDERR